MQTNVKIAVAKGKKHALTAKDYISGSVVVAMEKEE